MKSPFYPLYFVAGLLALFLPNTFLLAEEATPPQTDPPVENITLAQSSFLPKPTDRVILTITGKIAYSNQEDGSAQFDRKMLEQFSQKVVHTTTRWTEGMQEFEGVLMTDVLKKVGAKGTTVEIIAMDDYTSPKTPINEFEKYGAILAMKRNGEYMRVREKGPLWLVYPIDDYPELKKDLLTQYKFVWHVRSIVIE